MNRLGALLVYFARTALRGIASSPGVSTIATGTIGVALVLVGAFALLVVNMQGLVDRFGDALQVTAFLEDGLPETDRQSLVAVAASVEGVESVRLVSEDEALERFRQGVGRGSALLEGLAENPLPASLELTLQPTARSAEGLARVAGSLDGVSGIADLSSGQDWVEGYVRALALVRAVALGLGAILALATTLIVGNTIRLAVLSRRDELEILSLVGASRGFVNTPFLLEGLLQGAAGGLLAWLLLYGLFRVALPGFEVGLEMVLGGASPRFFDPGESSLLIGGGAALGLLGSGAALATEWRP